MRVKVMREGVMEKGRGDGGGGVVVEGGGGV